MARHAFQHRHNHRWLVRKHGHLTPTQVRQKLAPRAAIAA
jgi:hypothetical protein